MNVGRGTQLLPDAGRKPAYGELAGDIDADERLRDYTEHGADIDQGAAVSLQPELPERGLRSIDIAKQIGFHQAAKHRRRDFLEPAEMQDCRAVHPYVDPAETGDGDAAHSLDRRFVRHIDGKGERLPSQASAFVRDLPECIRAS